MKIAFYKWKWNIIDKAIRIWTRWPYSHCELVLNNWTMFSSSWMDWGVRIKEFSNSDNWDVYDTNVWETPRVKTIMKDEMGKEYDFIWLFFNFIVDLNLEDRNKRFCSEICWYILWIENSSQYWPNWLFEILKEKNIINS